MNAVIIAHPHSEDCSILTIRPTSTAAEVKRADEAVIVTEPVVPDGLRVIAVEFCARYGPSP